MPFSFHSYANFKCLKQATSSLFKESRRGYACFRIFFQITISDSNTYSLKFFSKKKRTFCHKLYPYIRGYNRLTVSFLISPYLELRSKNEHVGGRYEAHRILPKLKVSGQSVTS